MENTEYDAVVLGTGLTQSIVAGALARAGKKVLHLDSNDFYGEHHAVFDLRTLLQKFTQRSQGEPSRFWASYSKIEVHVAEDDVDVDHQEPRERAPANDGNNISNHDSVAPTTSSTVVANTIAYLRENDIACDMCKEVCAYSGDQDFCDYLSSCSAESADLRRCILLSKLLRAARQFNLELSPKLLFSRGPLVELLVSSGVGSYLEFKALEETYLYHQGSYDRVPGSKEDVFMNDTVNLIDKRRLMKFLSFAAEYDAHPDVYEAYRELPYRDFLQTQKLNPRLIAFILHTIALVASDEASSVSTPTGLQLTQKHLQSLGRWGKTAFLVALYGAGSELIQAFCRLCAVYGGTYILAHPLRTIAIDVETSRYQVIADDGSQFTASWLIASPHYLRFLPSAQQPQPKRIMAVWRAIVVTNKSLHDTSTLNVTVVPPDSDAIGNKQGVYMCQQSWDVSSCPKENFILYFWTAGDGTKADIESAFARVVQLDASKPEDPRPKALLWTIYEEQVPILSDEPNTWVDDHFAVCASSSATLDFENSATAAEEIFRRIAPEAEFLPPRPDVEDTSE
ncbi:hypothetical protein HDU85_000679 [Gaertneriomyces sp. JEL0708]|nr:hypothetical protein HDU85_000679 [Gaertneriomyces sp. JEL0708]